MIDYLVIKQHIFSILEKVIEDLKKEDIEYIKHYLEHDEYEIAFEILFIEIMKLENLPRLDYKMCKKIALDLKLDKETIYDLSFWNNFIEFGKNYVE